MPRASVDALEAEVLVDAECPRCNGTTQVVEHIVHVPKVPTEVEVDCSHCGKPFDIQVILDVGVHIMGIRKMGTA